MSSENTSFPPQEEGSQSSQTRILLDSFRFTNTDDTNNISKKRKRQEVDSDGYLNYPGGTTQPEQVDGICQECIQLEFEKAVDPDIGFLKRNKKGIFIADVGQRFREPFESYSCALCRHISSCRIETPSKYKKWKDNGKGDHLYAFPSLELHYDVDPMEEKMRVANLEHNSSCSLVLIPSGYVYNNSFKSQLRHHFGQTPRLVIYKGLVQPPELLAGSIVHQQFNPDLVSSWLEYCQQHHKICKSKARHPVLGSRLIDCESKRIIPAKQDHAYVALSYVWGASQDKTPSVIESNLPKHLPTVILDAIEVTKAMNMRYLWVDKYCIDQSDDVVKQEQINAMDQIYADAELTIIAAAGNDESYGLPGVRSKNRSPQFVAKVKNVSILSTMAHPHTSILHSKWSTRGWTYQEAVLSRRRLVFNEEQVYFECNAMNCYESSRSNLDLLHCKDRSKFRKYMRAGLFGAGRSHVFGRFNVENLGRDAAFIRFLGHVEGYTARELRYDQDSLIAFAGISKNFESLKYPVVQIMGIPCLHPKLFGLGDKYMYYKYFVDALCWRHKQKSSHSNSIHSPRRREQFPSWSWSGWAGEVQYDDRSYSDVVKFEVMPGPKKIMFEAKSDSTQLIVELGDMFTRSRLGKERLCHPIRLHIVTNIVPAAEIQFHTNSESSHLTVFGFDASIFISSGPSSTQEIFDGFKNDELRCLLMGCCNACYYFLIVKLNGDTAMRIGLMKVPMSSNSDPSKYFASEELQKMKEETFCIE